MSTESRRDLVERTEAFAEAAVWLFRDPQARPDRAGWIIGKQFLRAATSVGANVEEAQDAESRADFVHKYRIARKEVREARFWLRLMQRTALLPAARIAPALDESNQLYAILTAIIRKASG